jgi:hypothetical protein
MKNIMKILLLSVIIAGCGLETGKVKTNFTSNVNGSGCNSRVCNVQVTRSNPLVVTFQSNNLANNSYTASLCLNDGSGCSLGAQVVCDSNGSCRLEGNHFATAARTAATGTVEITFGLSSLGDASIQIQ